LSTFTVYRERVKKSVGGSVKKREESSKQGGNRPGSFKSPQRRAIGACGPNEMFVVVRADAVRTHHHKKIPVPEGDARRETATFE